MFSAPTGVVAKQKKDAHLDLIKHSSSRGKVEADQRKSFRQKYNMGCAYKPSRTNGYCDIRMRAGYVRNCLHSIFRVIF